jgi:hypothetical protein
MFCPNVLSRLNGLHSIPLRILPGTNLFMRGYNGGKFSLSLGMMTCRRHKRLSEFANVIKQAKTGGSTPHRTLENK